MALATGEHPVEYVGFGYAKPYAEFLYNYFTTNSDYQSLPVIDITTLLNKIDRIWAFFDVFDAFREHYDFEIPEDWCFENDLEYMLLAKFLLSDKCNDECYEYFIKSMNSSLIFE